MTSRAKLSVRLLGWSAVAFAAFVTLFIWVGNNLERLLNRVIDTPLPPVAGTTAALHNKSIVADLHCDSLLFGRDLLQHSTVGHIDLPRLQIGGVNIQILPLQPKYLSDSTSIVQAVAFPTSSRWPVMLNAQAWRG